MNTVESNDKPVLIVISGPSGVGKDAVLKQVAIRLPNSKFEVTFTSRPPRDGEIDGVDYNFITRREFERRMEEGFFLESVPYRIDPKTGEPEYKGTRNFVPDLYEQHSDILWRIDPSRTAHLAEPFNKAGYVGEKWEELQRRIIVAYIGVDSVSNWIKRRTQRDGVTLREVLPNMRHDYAIWRENRDFFRQNLIINPEGSMDCAVEELLRRIQQRKEALRVS